MASNTAPLADNDAYSTNEGISLVVADPGLLDGDSDAESAPLTAALVTGPVNGSLILNSNGGFTYTPASGFHGTDSFTYRANDGFQNSNPATVSITVVPQVGPSLLANGSFESGAFETASSTIPFNHYQIDDWTVTGNSAAFGQVPPNVPATDGERMAIFNGANETFDGAISQSFTTVPGTAYQLEFDAGIIGGAGASQILGVAVNGGRFRRRSLTPTQGVPPNGRRRALPSRRRAPATTAHFHRQSGTLAPGAADASDLLLDHVRIRPPPAPIRRRGDAQSVSLAENTPANITLTGSDADGDA